MRLPTLAAALILAASRAVGADVPVQVVAAENFYGGIAEAIGGDRVAVMSVLANPDQDPHLFEASPSVARAIAEARIVIANGADYDPWMARMIEASPSAERILIVAADLVGARAGANPHLWYAPATMPAVAHALADALIAVDPAHKAEYEARLAEVDAALAKVADKARELRARFARARVAATEPVFGYMAEALGLVVTNQRFQTAVMNDTEPSAADVAAFEDDIRSRRIRALFYNSQVTGPQTGRLLALAGRAGVPVVGVTETQPAGTTFPAWMLDQLQATEKALAGPSS
ncbi:MAG TPA: zinc ABC transporter substrate-binding protein [Bauldia sp.]|nr:zinc ABC transporter substrate-binding protein [Bauldia sp.]